MTSIQQQVDELEQKITDIFITIDNYGTAEEARADIRALIKERERLADKNARVDELAFLLEDFGIEDNTKPITDRIAELKADNKEEIAWVKRSELMSHENIVLVNGLRTKLGINKGGDNPTNSGDKS